MEFKLRLVPDRPTDGELVLEAETPLSGVEFIKEVGKDLRRSIDHVARSHHTTLGALAMYEITVPQAMAIASGKFDTVSTYTVIVENNLLKHFVFYKANVAYQSAGRRCYPYLENEATLVSMIDELAFLDAWAGTGYASRLIMSGNRVISGEYLNNEDEDNGGIGCKGCTACADPMYCNDHNCQHYHHRHHWSATRPPMPGYMHGPHHDHKPPQHGPHDGHHGFEPPPPPPPLIGNPSKPFTI